MKYTITETENGGYTFYGITDKNIYINEITTDKNAAKELCKRLNRGKVTETTLMDIIEDFIE